MNTVVDAAITKFHSHDAGSFQDKVQPEVGKITGKGPDLRKLVKQQDLIRENRDVPGGLFVRLSEYGLPDHYAENFALIRKGESSLIVLIAVEALTTHARFNVQSRLKSAGVKAITERRATREIVRYLHEENSLIKEEQATSVEEKTFALIDHAVESNASDLHIETRGSYAQVFYRIHGERFEQGNISAATAQEMCNVLYNVHADADNKATHWNPSEVMETVIERMTKTGKQVQLRFSSAPIFPSGNFHVVIRLLVMDADTIRPMEELGYTQAQVEHIEEMIVGSQGMVVLVGPTNSGKSTSMQSFMERMFERRGTSIKVITVEDPVEYIIKRGCQSGIARGRSGADEAEAKASFSRFLKATLRQDPDAVMVGEIRDEESAEHVKHLVLAGRKMLTTLHVFEAFAVFVRLREIGVPDSVLFMEGFISGIVCQRLVPEVCPNCSMTLDEGYARGLVRRPTYERVLAVDPHAADLVRVRCHEGCDHCRGMGIVGRTPCAEILVPDEGFLRLMSRGDIAGARDYLDRTSRDLDVDGYGTTMMAHAVQKMLQGRLDPVDIEQHVHRISKHVIIIWFGNKYACNKHKFCIQRKPA